MRFFFEAKLKVIFFFLLALTNTRACTHTHSVLNVPCNSVKDWSEFGKEHNIMMVYKSDN